MIVAACGIVLEWHPMHRLGPVEVLKRREVAASWLRGDDRIPGRRGGRVGRGRSMMSIPWLAGSLEALGTR